MQNFCLLLWNKPVSKCFSRTFRNILRWPVHIDLYIFLNFPLRKLIFATPKRSSGDSEIKSWLFWWTKDNTFWNLWFLTDVISSHKKIGKPETQGFIALLLTSFLLSTKDLLTVVFTKSQSNTVSLKINQSLFFLLFFLTYLILLWKIEKYQLKVRSRFLLTCKIFLRY